MIPLSDLPTLNAILNATAAILLLMGRRFIKRKEREKHRMCMLSAFGVSILFLISYLIYHYQHGSQPFQGTGWVRPVYFTILLSHTVLAAGLAPLVVLTLRRALRKEYERHQKLARWTYPIWLYVSVTGVVIYVMLYHLFVPDPSPLRSAITLLASVP
ncbi:MAG TPA: DUF420 domain-containing protein [Bacteroidota bacterium]|nr:DUF420 domain-containing protein [Bacteroidota bacterium]